MSLFSTLQILVHIVLLRPFLRLFSGINIIGQENIKSLDRYIIVANHNSHLDICLLFSVISITDIPRTHAVAAEEYFSASRFLFRLVKFFFNPIFVSRGQHSIRRDPLEAIEEKLAAGDNVIIFPEGTRGKAGELQHFKSGIGRLVVQFPDVPIIPIFISGTERGLPKSKMLLLPFWNNVIIGPPKLYKGKHKDITHLLEETIEELSRSESVQRHKRPEHKAPPASIAFLGIDGSGKSTVSKMTAVGLSASSTVCRISDGMEFFEDGVDREIQPLITEKIRETIGSYAKKASSLKSYKIPKLTELLLRNHLLYEAGRWYLPDVIVMDGCPLLNLVAWAALYKEGALNNETCAEIIRILSGKKKEIARNDPIFTQFPELWLFTRLGITTFVVPDMVILLDILPSAACERISSRSEQRQVHETEDKLQLLRQSYLMVCEVVRQNLDIPVLIVDAQDTREDITDAVLRFIHSSAGKSDGKP